MRVGYPSQDTIRGDRRDLEVCSYALFLVNDSGLRVVPLPASGAVVIGRGGDTDVRVADPGMSRRHVRIDVGAAFYLEDLHSANGTSISGCRICPGERRLFAPGEAITVGATTILIRDHPGPGPATAAAAPRVELLDDDACSAPALADRAAASMISVLLLGETGAGKDVLAERIHRASPRSHGPFLRLNCAAFSPALLASELFGHEKGSFTGATSAQRGLLPSAAGGTVFLDEIGDLPAELQAMLLLVLERREVLPVGAVRPQPLDVRFISATNRELPREVAAGRFRADLYFRLNGITIEVRPLRARVAEIEGLARQFAGQAARSLGREPPELTEEVLAVLRAHAWPGNVRELRAVVERAVLLGTGRALGLRDLAVAGIAIPPRPGEADREPEPAAEATPDATPEATTERQQIAWALARCGGNQSRAARLLGISRNTLIARLEKYGFARPLSPRGAP